VRMAVPHNVSPALADHHSRYGRPDTITHHHFEPQVPQNNGNWITGNAVLLNKHECPRTIITPGGLNH
jgi:hypothetical protein